MGFEDAGLGYSVALHLGTLIAVVAYFWKDWWEIGMGTLKRDSKQTSLFIYLVLATIPAAVAGLLLEDFAETTFRSPLLVAITMSVLGGILWFADSKAKDNTHTVADVTLRVALIIGCSQALALIPGVSRSGITITTALILGLSRPSAARFSFLLSTPIILGASVLKYKDILWSLTNPQALAGLAASAIFGFLSIHYLLKLVRTSSYKIFCVYRFVFTAVVLAFLIKEGL